MIRPLLRRLARWLTAPDALWSALPGAWRRNRYLQLQRAAALAEGFARRRSAVFADQHVRSGPLAGLDYAGIGAVGSVLFPKVIGSYESELHDDLEILLRRQPPLVIDVGFAEGYYLVGLGRRLPGATLVGYDLQPQAHQNCLDLARANRVNPERLQLQAGASVASVRQYLPAPSLVICDCEGFELELFTAGTLELWARSDLLIECHDFLRPQATATLSALLATTHQVRVVTSVPAGAKLGFLAGPEFRDFRPEEKIELLAEGRPGPMQWIVAEARHPS